MYRKDRGKHMLDYMNSEEKPQVRGAVYSYAFYRENVMMVIIGGGAVMATWRNEVWHEGAAGERWLTCLANRGT